jgi:phage gpG-like protein
MKQIGNLTVPNKKAAIFLDQWVQKNFQTEGSLVGGWRAIKRSGKILQDTGRLRGSFTPFADDDDAGIGSDLKYSAAHDKGTSTIPQRRILPRHDDVDKDLFRIYNTHVQGLTRRNL